MRALPQGLLSRGVGALADIPLPGLLRRPVLGTFARSVGIDVSEAEHPLGEYRSVNAFFVRRLKAGARTFPEDPRTLASPVDGVVGAFGAVESGRAIQAKGRDYSVADLLGDPAMAARMEGGIFATVYLSPRHYHRIHTPLPGSIVEARHVPGRLFPVNRPAVQAVDRLFVVNERLVVTMDTEVGPVTVVAVGAYNVGRISAAFDPSWGGRDGASVTNRGTRPPAYRRYDPPKTVRPGAEIMAFHLGSTIVLLAGPGSAFVDGLTSGGEIRAGAPVARG
jgi:phosphatidylserine decarboxylase